MQPNTLMLTYVISHVPPTSRHLSLVCCAGSHGYGALKEMMDNGEVGRTLLLESDDLRDVENASDACCLLYYCVVDQVDPFPFDFNVHIPPTVSHVQVSWNTEWPPGNLLQGCSGLQTIELIPLVDVKQINIAFLAGCSGLGFLDLSPLFLVLSPLSEVTFIESSFLEGCTGLTSIDLSPLSNVTTIYGSFLKGCTGLKSIDLSPLSQLEEIEENFLEGCTGLTSIDVSVLSELLTTVPGAFLKDCSGLKSVVLGLDNVWQVCYSFLEGCNGLTEIDLSSLSQVDRFQDRFLEGCTGLKVIDLSPLTNLAELPDDFVEKCQEYNIPLILSPPLAPYGGNYPM